MLTDAVRDVLAQAAGSAPRGTMSRPVRASSCLLALAAASSLPSRGAVGLLVTVALAGLRPPR